MALANSAYYASHDPFADFTTAPEIAQMFGEVLGAWAAIVWVQMGSPSPVILAEVGPGRGTLMQDVLRIVSRVAPAFSAAVQVHFIETSERLRAEQAKRVPGAVWHDDLENVPAGPMILLANEFLDALPIRQFVRVAGGWAERYVQGERFVELPAEGPDREAPIGAVVEVSDASVAWVGQVARRLSLQGGAALLLDYGMFESRSGESFQALRDGKPADPLASPGEADLTAHVDFGALRAAAGEQGATVWGPVAQGMFLEALGFWKRTECLAAANSSRAAALRESAARLALPSRMGALFKAMCVTHPGLPAPPGFEG